MQWLQSGLRCRWHSLDGYLIHLWGVLWFDFALRLGDTETVILFSWHGVYIPWSKSIAWCLKMGFCGFVVLFGGEHTRWIMFHGIFESGGG